MSLKINGLWPGHDGFANSALEFLKLCLYSIFIIGDYLKE